MSASRLTDILCHREQRYLGAQLSFHYDRRQIILERNKTSEELAGKYVDLYDYTDGRLEVRWKGISLPYRVFSKDQRVSHAAIVENKRLGHALAACEGAAGTQARDEGPDQQRQGRIQEEPTSAIRTELP